MLTIKRISIISLMIVVLPVFFYFYMADFRTEPMVYGDLHFYYVIFSSAIAILVGLASYLEYKKNRVEKIFYISVGFIGVGVFYTFHALVAPNMKMGQFFEFPNMISNINAFVLFGDLSRLWLALMMFMPDSLFEHRYQIKKYFNGYVLLGLFILLSGLLYIGLLTPEIFPIFKNDDLTDTNLAILTKVVTLLFLGINSLKYYYSYRAKQNITILSFIIGLCLIMETVIIFMISKPWSSNWWLAHNLFLMSYLVIGSGVLYSYFDKQKYEYFDVLGQISRYTKLLEENNVKLKQLANYDALTGLSNRSHFINTTEEYIKKAGIEHTTFALMFIDLDYFKTINDKYGHQVGDELLKIISKKIISIIKSNDLAARIGGDEFLLLFKDVSQTQIDAISKRILDRLSEPIIINENICKVGASIGVSIFPNNGKTIDELISKSDEAMYRVKKEGGSNYLILSNN
ncbi:MAG: GGDEF domain-containing protein [Erysipelotrichaceae bacterium]|nr:GGDEF domain-containing protein [Erysipelotrichaceae bacterium]